MRHAPRFLLLLLLPPPRPPRAHTALGRKARRTQHSHSPLPRPSTHAQPTRTPSPSSSSPPPSVAQHDVVRQARKASQAPLRHRHRPAAQCLRQVPHSERLCHECVACPRSLLLFPSAPAHSLPFPLAVYRAHQWTQGYDVKSAADGSSSYRLTCATHRSVPLLPLLPLLDPSLKLTPCLRLQQLHLLDRRRLHHLLPRGRPQRRRPLGLPHLDHQLPARAQPRRALPPARRQGREPPPLAPRPERPGRRPPAPRRRRLVAARRRRGGRGPAPLGHAQGSGGPRVGAPDDGRGEDLLGAGGGLAACAPVRKEEEDGPLCSDSRPRFDPSLRFSLSPSLAL